MAFTSIPEIEVFNPKTIPFQLDVIKDVRKFEYSQGALEILLSGSVGSAKSLLLAHLIATHALANAGAGVLVGRRTLKDLKNTLWAMILRHCPMFYNFWNKSDMTIKLPNNSIIYGVSWDDGRYDKFRSYELSMAAIEELTENRDPEIYNEIKMRVGRIPHIKENVIACATNPDAPSHWAYNHFIENQSQTRRVYYSKTKDNPFLPSWYIKQLQADMDTKMALRMLEGQWIEIHRDQVYYEFDSDRNYVDSNYQWNKDYPVAIMHDFNIGLGKPMSAAAGQYIDNVFHVAITFLVEGSRTADILEDMAHSGIFDNYSDTIEIYGDASGRNNDTRSIRNDYDIISKYLGNYKRQLNVVECVPRKNPPLRRRHNVVNAHFLNQNNDVRLFIYKQAQDAAKGFRLTQYKCGSSLVEDDTLREQHVTTAIGYWIDYSYINAHSGASTTVEL